MDTVQLTVCNYAAITCGEERYLPDVAYRHSQTQILADGERLGRDVLGHGEPCILQISSNFEKT